MSRKPIVVGCLLSGGLIVIGCSGFLFWLNSLTTYSVEAYRSVDVIAGKNEDRIKLRLFPVTFDDCTIEFEWYTYDNADITAGPYKLFIVVSPRVESLTAVNIAEVEIISSTETTHQLSRKNGPVISVPIQPAMTIGSGKSESALHFSHATGEEITTRVTIEFVHGESTRTETIDLQWQPVTLEMWSSIVSSTVMKGSSIASWELSECSSQFC